MIICTNNKLSEIFSNTGKKDMKSAIKLFNKRTSSEKAYRNLYIKIYDNKPLINNISHRKDVRPKRMYKNSSNAT